MGRYDAITLGNDMKKPTKYDILEMRQQMETVDSANEMERNASPETSTTGQACQPDSKPEDCLNSCISSFSSPNENELVEMPALIDDSCSDEGEQTRNQLPTGQSKDLPPHFRYPEGQRKTG